MIDIAHFMIPQFEYRCKIDWINHYHNNKAKRYPITQLKNGLGYFNILISIIEGIQLS